MQHLCDETPDGGSSHVFDVLPDTQEHLEEQRTLHVVEALLEVVQAMVQGATRDGQEDQPTTEAVRPVMQRIAALTRAVVGCQCLGFVRVEPETTRLRPLAVVGLSPEQEQQWWRKQEQQDVRLSDGVDHSLLERLRANELLLLDLTHPPYRERANPYGIRQMLMAPLVFGSQLLGLLTLDYGSLDHSYTDQERVLIRAVCKLAAEVMERERLWQERQEARARQRALRAAHERMVQMIELAHDAVIVRDPNSRIVYWNQGAERLYGWNKHEALGQITHALLSTHFPSSREAIDAHLAAWGQWEGMVTHTSRRGKRVVVESRQVLVRDDAGEPEAILEINRDVTERERLLKEREEARANELAASEANRRMDEFIGIASHELKTPLTSIKGNLQLAGRRLTTVMDEVHADDEHLLRQLEGVQTVLKRADRQVAVQNRLVSDLVDGSRIQTDQLELRLERTDLVTVVREVVESQRVATPMRLIPFETSALVVHALADGERIGQVVVNYLSNALKYSPQERPVAVRLAAQGELVRVEVADSGPGLSAEQQTCIWERFYRVPEIEVQSGTGVGLGLGLPICRMIIEHHHGEVGVQSTPGKGSTFWFTLPRAEGA